ncbi:MAG: 16S rRNA (adenine(1518)-N(6)/adenine(1519)-N(6))-dimethyltransferase RsmA [Candidatus Moranbacteria bacterium]|nr:16S rRNA (adenine(1518)-N(6)/adenine(1519)-N(6))-dimethyltransferase RsmA [Candidatus Moranbacteria bacterium]
MNRPKKSLGQNFLRDEKVLQKIIDASGLVSTDSVIEIGPGEGVLTGQLAKYAGKIIAIELDSDLVPIIAEKFQTTTNIEIIHGDILNINLPRLLADRSIVAYKVIANIPYYITSPIIRLFLEQAVQPQEMILMVQKEVAERIVAGPGQGSILSVSVQYYATTEIIFKVSKQAFFPIPKVDSAVIKIIPTKKFDKEADKVFFRIVKAGFAAKRKTLLNNLSNSLQLDKNIVEEKLQTLGIAPTARAQELSLEKWKEVASRF